MFFEQMLADCLASSEGVGNISTLLPPYSVNNVQKQCQECLFKGKGFNTLNLHHVEIKVTKCI